MTEVQILLMRSVMHTEQQEVSRCLKITVLSSAAATVTIIVKTGRDSRICDPDLRGSFGT